MINYLLRQLKGWQKTPTNSKIMNTVQKNSKGYNPLDFSMNIIDKPYRY